MILQQGHFPDERGELPEAELLQAARLPKMSKMSNSFMKASPVFEI